jgi:hypothetical protein
MAKKGVYRLLFSIEAPDLTKSEVAGKLITQLFNEDEIVMGEYYKKENILVDGRYVIPLAYVEKEDKLPYLKKDSSFDETIDRLKQQSLILSEKEKERLNDIGNSIKSQIEGKKAQQIKAETKAMKNGALLGLGIGIITALYLKRNIWLISLIGLSVGGYVEHKIVKAKQGNNEVEPIA